MQAIESISLSKQILPPKKQEFGSALVSSQLFSPTLARSIFTSLEKNPIADTLAKDVLGFNAPKIALARTGKELLDILPLEFGNTAITAVSTFFLPALLRHPVQALSGVKRMSDLVLPAAKTLSSQAKLARLGVSFGFMFPFAAGFWAVPFIRNYMTLNRLKTANFEAILGYHTHKKSHRSFEEEKKYQLSNAWGIIGIGVALGAAALVGFSLAAKRNGLKPLSKGMEKFFNTWELKGNPANQVADNWPTFLFWALPAYAGWIHAARGKNERREQLVKGVNSCIWFSALTPMLKKFWFIKDFNTVLAKNNLESSKVKQMFKAVPGYEEIKRQFRGPLQKKLLKLKDRQSALSFVITIVMLSMTPQLLNIYFTKKRLDAERVASR